MAREGGESINRITEEWKTQRQVSTEIRGKATTEIQSQTNHIMMGRCHLKTMHL